MLLVTYHLLYFLLGRLLPHIVAADDLGENRHERIRLLIWKNNLH